MFYRLVFVGCGSDRITPTSEQRIAGGLHTDSNQLPSLALVYSNNAAIKCTANISKDI